MSFHGKVFHDKVFDILSRDYPDWQRYQTEKRPHPNELRKDFAIDSTDNRYEEYVMGEFNVETASGDVKVYAVGIRRVVHS